MIAMKCDYTAMSTEATCYGKDATNNHNSGWSFSLATKSVCCKIIAYDIFKSYKFLTDILSFLPPSTHLTEYFSPGETSCWFGELSARE